MTIAEHIERISSRWSQVHAAVEITIIGEPASKANSRKPATVGKGDARRTLWIKSDKAREYERIVIPQVRPDHRRMLTGRIRATFVIYYRTELPDLDESIILDMLQAKYEKNKRTGARELWREGVYVNDRQVRERHTYHAIDKANPRTVVLIEALEPQQASLPVEKPEVSKRLTKAEEKGLPF